MISATEFKWIKESVESGKVDAIVANKIITALKNQQDQIKQLEKQLTNVQLIVKSQKQQITDLECIADYWDTE